MKLSDAASGALAVSVGLLVAGYARTFPPMPGQPIGPGAFPTAAGLALAGAGAALVLSGVRRRERPLVEPAEWMRRPRMAVNVALVLAVVLFYVGAVERLGFFLTAATTLAVLFGAFGVRRARIVPIALAVTFVIHYGFYTLLRVPLPWGVLEGIAW